MIGQRFDELGNLLEDECQVNSYSEGDQYNCAAAMNADGFVRSASGMRMWISRSFNALAILRTSVVGAEIAVKTVRDQMDRDLA